jgi:hypothetical protein
VHELKLGRRVAQQRNAQSAEDTRIKMCVRAIADNFLSTADVDHKLSIMEMQIFKYLKK